MPRGRLNPADRDLSDEALMALFSDPAQIPERFSMALMLDEGVNQIAISPILDRCKRINITTVQKQGLAGEKSDYRLLAHARRIACTFVVEDRIYEQLHHRITDLGLSHAGIIWVRDSFELLNPFIEFVVHMYQRSIEKDAPDLLHREFWQV